jgi:DNA invertase Pin-like site-specific DNA recombinase
MIEIMQETNKVYGYIRVSTDTQDTKGYGLETQEHAIKEHCKKNNLELVECYRDIGISGTEVDKRAGLMNLLSSLDGVSKVVVYDTSRLWRDDIATGCIKQALIRRKADVISIQQPDYSICTKNHLGINGHMKGINQNWFLIPSNI